MGDSELSFPLAHIKQLNKKKNKVEFRVPGPEEFESEKLGSNFLLNKGMAVCVLITVVTFSWHIQQSRLLPHVDLKALAQILSCVPLLALHRLVSFILGVTAFTWCSGKTLEVEMAKLVHDRVL